MYKQIIKTSLDFIAAIVVLFALVWLFPIIAIGLILFSPIGFNKIIFKQLRVGKNDQLFEIYKFRTLSLNEEEFGFGQFLRKSGLDELPQLFNILQGEMSFVGPRPLLPEYLSKYTDEQRKRHLVKPGVTGLVQVKGGKEITWEKRLIIDVEYTNNQSFYLDTKILFFPSIFTFLVPVPIAS